jgi:hypothetical protein
VFSRRTYGMAVQWDAFQDPLLSIGQDYMYSDYQQQLVAEGPLDQDHRGKGGTWNASTMVESTWPHCGVAGQPLRCTMEHMRAVLHSRGGLSGTSSWNIDSIAPLWSRFSMMVLREFHSGVCNGPGWPARGFRVALITLHAVALFSNTATLSIHEKRNVIPACHSLVPMLVIA